MGGGMLRLLSLDFVEEGLGRVRGCEMRPVLVRVEDCRWKQWRMWYCAGYRGLVRKRRLGRRVEEVI